MDGHIHHGPSFDVDDLVVGFQIDGVPGMEFCFGKDAMTGHKINILGGDIGGQASSGGGEIAQASPGGFFLPFVGISVAIENNPLVLGQRVADQFLQSSIKILS